MAYETFEMKVDKRAHYQAGIAETKFAAAEKSFEQYLNSVKILERPQPLMGITGGVRPLEKWPHVMEMAAALEESQKIADLKARQVGGSWLFGGARAS